MERLFHRLQEYYRYKRMLHIKFIRSQAIYKVATHDTSYPLRTSNTPSAWTRLLIHLFILVSLNLILGGSLSLLLRSLNLLLPIPLLISSVAIVQLVNSWLSVEITDYIWLNHTKAVRTVSSVMFLLCVLLFTIALSLLLLSQGTDSLGQSLMNWQTQINQTLQRNAATSVRIDAVEGKNWSLLRDSSGKLEPIIATEAQRICGDRLGKSWQLPAPKQLQTLIPHPKLSRSVSVWAIDDQKNLIRTTLASSSDQSGNSFMSHKLTDLSLTLCYQEKQ